MGKKLSFHFILLTFIFLSACKSKPAGPVMPKYDDLLLQKVRAAGAAIPGQLPVSINYIKFAASIRQWKDIVEGGSEDPCTMARTAFQINYDKDYIMVDAGMDKAVHHFFEKQAPQPFDDTLANQVATALQSAKLILITHEHGDHVAGAIRNANNTVPSKTILTTDQANTLVNNPQMPEIKLDETKRDQYIIVDFASVLPVAPGVVLIKAPGHTPGEIMVYTKLANGREYIFTGDVSWSFKGIQEKKLKPKSERERLSEGTDNIRQEIDWLSDRLTKDNMIMLVSHDDIMLPQYEAQGLIGKGFKTLP